MRKLRKLQKRKAKLSLWSKVTVPEMAAIAAGQVGNLLVLLGVPGRLLWSLDSERWLYLCCPCPITSLLRSALPGMP